MDGRAYVALFMTLGLFNGRGCMNLGWECDCSPQFHGSHLGCQESVRVYVCVCV